MKSGKQRKERRRHRLFIPKMWGKTIKRQMRFKLQTVYKTLESGEHAADEAQFGGSIVTWNQFKK